MGIDATQQAILVGAVEGGTVREPAVTIVTQRDPGIKVVALGGVMFPDQPGTVIAVTAAFLRDHSDKVQAIVNGAVRAVRLIGTGSRARRGPCRAGARQGHCRWRDHRQGAGVALVEVSLPIRAASSRQPLPSSAIRSRSARSTARRRSTACSTPASSCAPRRPDVATTPLMRLLPPLGLLIFLALWEAVPRLGLVNPAFLPPPSVLPARLPARIHLRRMAGRDLEFARPLHIGPGDRHAAGHRTRHCHRHVPADGAPDLLGGARAEAGAGARLVAVCHHLVGVAPSARCLHHRHWCVLDRLFRRPWRHQLGRSRSDRGGRCLRLPLGAPSA